MRKSRGEKIVDCSISFKKALANIQKTQATLQPSRSPPNRMELRNEYEWLKWTIERQTKRALESMSVATFADHLMKILCG